MRWHRRSTTLVPWPLAVIAVLALIPASVNAQWLTFKQPGIPRTADGAPDLSAPVPRTPDGRPDLSGLWVPRVNGYWFDISAPNVFDESAFKPGAETLFQQHAADYGRDAPWIHCLPFGPGAVFQGSYRIIQSPTVVAVLQGQGRYRQIFTDGRELPKDPNPTWMGYSVAHWETDTLVVETAGFNSRSWLDLAGHPHSESLRVHERFHRLDFGHMDFQITFDDPETFTKPLTISLPMNYQPDTEMQEFVCENERDSAHLVSAPKQVLSPAKLAKYAGTYEFSAGTPVRFPMKATFPITTDGVHLYFGPFPLNLQTETRFDGLFGGSFQFSLDSSGEVTAVTITPSPDPCGRDVGGPSTFVRKR